MRRSVTDTQRSPWLELARQQSRTLAERRAKNPPRWQWSSVQATDQRSQARGVPTWAMALSTLAVLLLASGTWAFVHKLRQPAVSPAPKKAKPAAVVKAAVPKHHLRRRKPAKPLEVTPATPAPAVEQRPPARAAVRHHAPAREAQREPQVPAASSEGKPGEIIFGNEEMPGGGELILVAPPSRLKPLWTVEEYKRKH